MRKLTAGFFGAFLFGLLFEVTPADAAESVRFAEGTYEAGRLEYVNGLPVLVVQGTPEEIGRQQAALTFQAAKELIAYPEELLSVIGQQDAWARFVEMGRAMVSRFPKDHLAELEAFAKRSGCDRDQLIGLNTVIDTYRGGFGCSSLIVAPERSATGGPLFGRNLDFVTLGKLQKYSLVVVCRPNGKHAFASVIFPGMFGCLSGMNDAGLAVAVHEVFFSRDGAGMFDAAGVPYSLAFRRVLEECTTVEEAQRLLRAIKRTTLLNLAVCDRRGGAVLEITPKNVELRRGKEGICACTNHFRSPRLATFALAWRYRRLIAARNLAEVDLDEVARKLREASLGPLTMQTMIFEPSPLVLHLAIGSCPSSSLPLERLELAPLLKPPGAPEVGGR